MNTSSVDALFHLASRIGLSPTEGPERIREKLEDSLAPLVHVALRRGIGQPALVQWVRRQLPGGTSPAPGVIEPPGLAREITSKLAALLVQGARTGRPALDTVAGP